MTAVPNVAVPLHSQRMRVYFEDTDAGGIVYHANYLRFFERCRTDWLRALGVTHSALADQHRLVFVVRDLQVQYLAPARLDDELDIELGVAEMRRASMRLSQAARSAGSGEILASTLVRVAAMSLDSGRPAPLPNDVADRVRACLPKTERP